MLSIVVYVVCFNSAQSNYLISDQTQCNARGRRNVLVDGNQDISEVAVKQGGAPGRHAAPQAWRGRKVVNCRLGIKTWHN